MNTLRCKPSQVPSWKASMSRSLLVIVLVATAPCLAFAQTVVPPPVAQFPEGTVVDLACLAKAWRQCVLKTLNLPGQWRKTHFEPKGCPPDTTRVEGRGRPPGQGPDPGALYVSACLSEDQFMLPFDVNRQGGAGKLTVQPEVAQCHNKLISEVPYLKGEARECVRTLITPEVLAERLQQNTRRARAREAELCRLLDPEGTKCEQFKSVAD